MQKRMATGLLIPFLWEAADGRFRFNAGGSAVSLRGGGCGAFGITVGDWRGIGLFACGDCYWSVGAGVHQRRG
ncbi:hypothetical protein SDC9_208108 [bioreactor metagenome]|uniref:Uncharacterized protein n=1 Tax=bioreactor metagenome TaxID=1076179 RepID=A0A645JBC2_9ZZZZ